MIARHSAFCGHMTDLMVINVLMHFSHVMNILFKVEVVEDNFFPTSGFTIDEASTLSIFLLKNDTVIKQMAPTSYVVKL